MAVQTVKLGGKEFVILPKREYERLAAKGTVRAAASKEEEGDVAEARRRLQLLARGRSKTMPLKQLRAELGL